MNIYSDGEFTLAGNDRCAIILRSPQMREAAEAPLNVDGVYVDHNSYWRAVMVWTRPPLALPALTGTTKFYWTIVRGNGTSSVVARLSGLFDTRREAYANLMTALDRSKFTDWEHQIKTVQV